MVTNEATAGSKAPQAMGETSREAKESHWSKQAERLNEIKDLTKSSLVDLSSYKFDRDEANDYGE